LVSLVLFMVTFSEATATGASKAGDVAASSKKLVFVWKNA